jgi:hypothetical protein
VALAVQVGLRSDLTTVAEDLAGFFLTAQSAMQMRQVDTTATVLQRGGVDVVIAGDGETFKDMLLRVAERSGGRSPLWPIQNRRDFGAPDDLGKGFAVLRTEPRSLPGANGGGGDLR